MKNLSQKEKTFGLRYLVYSGAFIIGLCLHPSDNPWVFGLYSLSYFVIIVLTTGILVYMGLIFIRFKKKAFYILGANLLVLICVSAALEIGGQIYVYFHPSYRVIPFIPDPILGWKFIPNFKHKFTGMHWYSREYSATVKSNSYGFRDFERKPEKDKDIFRIAIVGDSMVAGRQVDFKKTAGQQLEKKLNQELGPLTGKRYEVLNFGIPGFGVDQMYLAWNLYASKFNPDLTFVYLFQKNYIRTVSYLWCHRGNLGIDDPNGAIVKGCLAIRPTATFTKTITRIIEPDLYIELDNLIQKNKIMDYFQLLSKNPLTFFLPLEYKSFVKQQKQFIEKELSGKRMVKHRSQSFVKNLLIQVSNKMGQFQREFDYKEIEKEIEKQKKFYEGEPGKMFPWSIINHVNLGLLLNFGKMVKNQGSDFVLVDAFQFHTKPFEPIQFASKMLVNLAAHNDFVYINLASKLNASKDNGIPVRWKYDSHLNETGNKIFADSLFEYLKEHMKKH